LNGAKSGFSLAELLLALLILGQIATFTIPKVLTAQQNAQKMATFRQEIATLSELAYLGVLQGKLSADNVYEYYRDNMNYIKKCTTNSTTQGCWDAVQGDGIGSANDTEPGFVAHSGASVVGFDNGGTVEHEQMIIDWNGAKGPNLHGDDQIYLRIMFEDFGGAKAGTVVAKPDEPLSVALYNSIFAN